MKIIYIISIVLLLLGCTEEERYQYPIVQTGDVVEITSSGVVFHGKIMNEENGGIIDHGFVWDVSLTPSLASEGYVKSLGTVSSNSFSAEVTSGFVSGQTYFLRAYVNNGSHTIYGRTVSFESQGSKAPIISSFTPEIATWGDTLVINGENFSLKANENKVKFGKFPSQVIETKNTELTVLIPEALDTSNVSIKLSFLNYEASAQKKFKLEPPIISNVSPDKGTYGDTITISGEYFSEGKTKVFFNEIEASINSINNTEIKATFPSGIEQGNVEIKVVLAYQEAVYNQGFTSTAPRISNISPKQSTWGDIITIEGQNFSSDLAKNIVRFDDIIAEVIEATNQTLKVRVPNDLLTQNSKVSVEVKEQINKSSDTFSLKNPSIDSFSPELATFGDLITIDGRNFNPEVSNNRVYFGEVEAIVSDATNNKLQVLVPDEYYSENGKVGLVIKIGELSTTSLTKFSLQLHEITSFNPTDADRNDEITIQGNNFNPKSDLNKVFLDEFELNIMHSTTSQMVVSIPAGITHGNHSLGIKIAGRKVVADNQVNVFEPFKKIADLPLVINGRAFSFSLNGYGFVGYENKLFRFDANLNSWSQMSNLPFYTNDNLSFTNSNEMGFVMITRQIWRYDPTIDEWNLLTTYDGPGNFTSTYNSNTHLLFEKENVLYVSSGAVLDYAKPDKEYILAYHISTNDWETKSLFGFPTNYSKGFSINGIGYCISDNQLFKYNDSDDTWELQFDTNGLSSSSTVISFEELIYFTDGRIFDCSITKKDLFSAYNLQNGFETRLLNIPYDSRRIRGVSFIIGTKAYIGSGFNYCSRKWLSDFYEFDSTKIKK